ncbi:Predicted hydrolase of the alpha/beta superfamily [Winogradskyella sediminis]|uniref:Predicted hydrolase of the alpha/beta superfamily n=2 Tax=Winogradskyella sediminis TaxID=1382466 RepID=A0A1H1QHQ9_9FLAO|nr:Predicted hydrolase of the alpha/beta superfamily [Winogradskyella sediminis]
MMKNLCYALILLILFSCKNETKPVENENPETNVPAVKFQHLKSTELYKGEIHRVDSFPSKYIQPRPVDVWLPEDYVDSQKYEVLYMHDGQMLFDAKTTWNKQEWKVDDWASKLMEENKTKDFIVVAIHNIPEIRWQDLFPQKAIDFIDERIKDSLVDIAGKKNIQLNGDNYLKFIVEELKPVIDETYSVSTEREHTFVMGSSMGGLMSMYAISEYPEIFGGAACLSTHWVGAMPMVNNPYPDAIFKYMDANLPQAGQHKLYFDYGNKTLDEHYPQYAPRVDAILKAKGYTDKDSKNLFFEGTDHSENSWNKRLDQPLTFLLDK